MTANPEEQPEITTTPVRGLTRPALKPMSFRLPTDVPALIHEAQAIAAHRGERLTRDQVVAQAIREHLERIRNE